MRFLMMILLFMVAGAAPAFAQVVDTPAPLPGSEWFANAGMIAALSVLIVGGLKRYLANVAPLSQVPTWIYCIVVSVVLTFIARSVFHTMTGPLNEALLSAIMAAATASGAREWFTGGNTTKTLRASAITAGVKGVKKGTH